MSSVRTVYAVTTGDYSSYQIHCLFETETDAIAYVEAVRAKILETKTYVEEYRTEPFQLWDGVPVLALDKWGDVVEVVS